MSSRRRRPIKIQIDGGLADAVEDYCVRHKISPGWLIRKLTHGFLVEQYEKTLLTKDPEELYRITVNLVSLMIEEGEKS